VLCFLCLCPQDTTSFDRLRSTSFRLRTQNEVALCANSVVLRTNDVMLRINDVVLRTNIMLRIDFLPLLCYNTPKVGEYMKLILDNILSESAKFINDGVVASYIPELAKANKDALGVCVITNEGKQFFSGDADQYFTMQSIVKPLILLIALMDNGMDRVRCLVGVEATGKPFDTFNYSDQALNAEHINPMVNAGAIALCTLIKGETYDEKFQRLLNLARKVSCNPNLQVDEQVYLSEKATGNKNRALAYMLKAYGLVNDNIEEILDCYFKACSIKVTAMDLAQIALVFANGGISPKTNKRLFDKKYSQYINAVLMTCGMYDGSGEFALNVGVPAKSGVGGGIMAVVPNRMGIGIFSPALDKKGNSIAGSKALELLSKNLELSIF